MKNKYKSIYFITYGCRLNQAETGKIRQEAVKTGLEIASCKEDADIFLINSCSVTDKAQKEVNKKLKKIRERYPKKEIIITGCGASDEHKNYAVVVKNEDKENLFSFVLNEHANQLKEEKMQPGRTRLMVKVQEGCNNFCAYCIVPYLRGRERSFSPKSIISELKTAEKSGFKEVVLCGVNVGKYDYKGTKLADLIREILVETAFPRIRLSSINPDDFSEELVQLWAQNPRLCPHFHISLQSGSDSVLARMGRKYDAKQYSSLISKLRKAIPEVQITTDIIVGFPSETEAEFEETIRFVKKIKFLKVHVFRYSPREGTRAAKMERQIRENIKKERAVKLQKLESEIRQEILEDYIDKEAEVLFEQERNGYYSGYTSNYIKVLKKSQKDLTNQIKTVKVKEAKKSELLAN